MVDDISKTTVKYSRQKEEGDEYIHLTLTRQLKIHLETFYFFQVLSIV